MAQRRIEETFGINRSAGSSGSRIIEETIGTIAPSRLRGVPNPETVATGLAGNAELSTSMSQAASEISQLRSVWQQQANLIAANTAAVQTNTSSQGGRSIASTVGKSVSGILGGGLGFLSPVFSGLMHLFGGGAQQPTPLPAYVPPPPVSIGGILYGPGTAAGGGPAAQQALATPAAPAAVSATNVTVHVNAMDSKSFMDHSSDIANAVREAMLNNHPINGVVADL